MLFDLRGRGRRRTIQVIYATLAILLGGGLVLFGIGGEVQGGFLDAIGVTDSGGTGSADDTFSKEEEAAQKRVRTRPTDPAGWANLAKVRYQVAVSGENYDKNRRAFTKDGRAKLAEVDQAWSKYLELVGERPDSNVAALMVQAYGPAGLNKVGDAARAQEIVVQARPTANGWFVLAQLSYAARQTRRGDLAAEKALDSTPKDLRETVKEQLAEAKKGGAAGAGGAGAGGGAGGAPGGAPPPAPSG